MSLTPCPICSRPVEAADYKPFCSKRCADVDLQRWFSGAYAITEAAPDRAEDRSPAQAGRMEDDLL